MRGVDHDGGAEFAADGAGRRLGRIGRAEDVADFVHRANAFIDECDALFRAGLGPVGLRNFAGRATGHEADDVVELRVALNRAENFAERLLVGVGNLEAEFFFQNVLGLGADAVFEFGPKEFADGAVKFHRLRGAHAENFGADDEQAGAREEINDVAGAAGGELEVIRLDEHQRAFGRFAGGVGVDVFQNAAVLVRILRPQFQFAVGLFDVRRGQHGRLEVTNVAIVVGDEVAVSVADGFTAPAVRA